jgi:type I restriction enzyme S subunit
MTELHTSESRPRWRPYPAYKDSGVPWLGKIPAHWEVKKLKFVSNLEMGQSPNSDDCNTDGEGTPFLQGNAEFGDKHPTPKIYCPTAKKYAKKDDFLLSVRAPVGALNIADQNYGIGRGLCAIKPNISILIHGYTYFLLDLIRVGLNAIATGSTYDAVSINQIGSLLCPIPCLDEQKNIKEFLNRETAKIDALVAKKERQIELLQEKRTALISRAVTRGLDPNVPLKDSGIDWLGHIPAHWTFQKLKYVSSIRLSSVDKKFADAEISVLLCNYVDVYYNKYITPNINFMEATATNREIDEFKLKKGDVLITKDSESWDDIAIPAYVLEELDGVLCGYHLAQIRSYADIVNSEYLFWSFYATGINYQFKVAATGITRYGLGKYWLDNAFILVPSIEEQRAIADFLERETAKIDALITKIRESIERLKEYRTALISAAVTGKIDVRKEVSR